MLPPDWHYFHTLLCNSIFLLKLLRTMSVYSLSKNLKTQCVLCVTIYYIVPYSDSKLMLTLFILSEMLVREMWLIKCVVSLLC